MKKTGLFLLAVLLLAAACGCAVTNPTDEADGGLHIANPVKPVDNASAFAPLDLYIDAPDGAAEVSYSTISDKIAQVMFVLNGHEYTYRAAHTDEDISGLYVEYEDKALSVEADGDGWYASVQVRTIRNSGGYLAEFAYGTARFSLYTPDAADAKTVSDLAVSLASVQCPLYVD